MGPDFMVFPVTSEFLNFSNRTIIKADMATFVKQCQNHLFHFLKPLNFFHLFVWAGRFLHRWTTVEGSPSCRQVIILLSLEHCIMSYSTPSPGVTNTILEISTKCPLPPSQEIVFLLETLMMG